VRRFVYRALAEMENVMLIDRGELSALFRPVLHVSGQHPAVARIAEHCRKHDDAHDNPDRQKYISRDQQPPVHAHLAIPLKSADAKETTAIAIPVRRLSKREHLPSQLHQTYGRRERTSVTIAASVEGLRSPTRLN
jgi:hypothetical protein